TSLRTQMFGVLLFSLLPLLALVTYQVFDEAMEIRRDIERTVVTIAQVNATGITRFLMVTANFLEEVSKNPDVRAMDPKRCGYLFKYSPAIYPHHSNLRTNDIQGHLVCSARPIPDGGTADLEPYPDEMRHTNGFTIGTPRLGPVSKRWTIPLSFPIRNDAGKVIGIVSAPFDLLTFNPIAGAYGVLPKGASASLFAPDMTLLALSREPENWIGTKRIFVPKLTELITRRSGTTRFVSTIDHVERIHGAAPVPGTDWTAMASIPAASLDAAEELLIGKLVAIYVLALLTSMGLAYLLARQTIKPIQAVAACTNKIAGGDTGVCAVPGGSRELVTFVTAFNDALDRLQHQQKELAASEKKYRNLLADQKQFTEILTHHLQEPARLQMTYSLRLGKLLGDDGLSPEVREALGHITRGSERLRLLLRDVQLYVALSQSPWEPRPCDPIKALEAALKRLETRISEMNAEIQYEAPMPSVTIDHERLVDVFSALIDNSLSYIRDGVSSTIRIGAERQGGNVVVTVEDNGIGIPEKFRERVFNVFERLHPEKGLPGTGIGLALVRRIIESAQGKVWIEASPAGGTRVLFSLPGKKGKEEG
ncbi:MAG: hypothetical protein HQL37_14220, partial [Alphaproteobacteria bacterium]|nr:hypothetical protein [Alphaproteobacteria bacterium]